MGNDFILINGSEPDGQEERDQEDKSQDRSQENRSQTGQSPYGYYQAGQGGGQPYQRQSYYQTPPTPPRPPVNKKKSSGLGRKMTAVIAGGLVFGLVAGVAFQGVNVLGDHFFGKEGSGQEVGTVSMIPAEDETEKSDDTAATDKRSSVLMPVGTTSVADVAKNTMPSVVAITSISVQEIPTFDFFGWGGGGTQEYEGESSGSGIIVGENDTELLIATNNHVVEGAKTLSVCFMGAETGKVEPSTDIASEQGPNGVGEQMVGADTENAVAAQIKGTDVENDLAVIAVKKDEIPQETMKEIKIAQLGSSDDLVVGEQVVAIGNALGYGQSVTSGYVSALDRYVQDMTTPCIQTDAAINPGNSGGALLNMSGQVIGINSAKLADNAVEGMGYAIPISTAMPILDDLMSRETREKVDDDKASYIGISCKDVSAEISQMYGMPTGVFVSELTEGGPAEKAGILPNDIVTSLDGTKMSSTEELIGRLEYYAAGETVEVVVQRAEGGQYKEHTISVTLGNRKDMKGVE